MIFEHLKKCKRRIDWPPMIDPKNLELLKKEYLFQTSISSISLMACNICNQLCFLKDMYDNGICHDCRGKKSTINEMCLAPVPDCLKNLTYPEKICISRLALVYLIHQSSSCCQNWTCWGCRISKFSTKREFMFLINANSRTG
jgi:hypothetical protein